MWMAIGIGVGAAFGTAMDDMALGVGFGAAIGAGVGAAFSGSGKS
jgi:hypothetical protein